MEKQKFIEKAVAWIKKKGYKRIKADIEAFETPTQYTRQKEDLTFTPDITGFQLGRKSFFEVALKSDNIRRKISKWKLLSTLASMKGGKFFLMAPRGHKAFAQRLVAHNPGPAIT